MGDFFEQDEPRWPTWLALCAFIITLVYTGIVVTVTNPDPSGNISVLLIYPLTMIFPMIIFVAAGYEHTDRQRWAWYLQAVAILLGAVIPELLQIEAYRYGTRVSSFKEPLYLVAYGAGITGGALYLTQKVGWEGNAMRMFLDSLLTGLAVLVLLRALLPNLMPTWPWTADANSALYLVGLDAGILFLISVMGARYGRNGGYLLLMSFLCFLALLAADVINLLLYWMPAGKQWEFMVYPLYITHGTCLAHGAYHSRRRPPQLNTQQINVMPVAEWLLWTKVPRMLVLLIVAVAIFNRNQMPPVLGSLTLLIFLSILREVLIAHDDRRVLLELHAAKERANAAEEQTKNFLDHIIHDLAAPLHSLQTALRRLQGEQNWLIRADLHYQQLDHLVQQLRAYQKARYQRLSVTQLAPIDIIPICFAAIDSIQDQAEHQGIGVRLNLTEEQVTVLADVISIRRVLDNLLANALNATPSGGIITLRATKVGRSKTRIEVIDTGYGIPLDRQAHIFSPMVRLQDGGTGLGLAIARELVQMMHGDIGVISQEGYGSTFWIELPLPLRNEDQVIERLMVQQAEGEQ